MKKTYVISLNLKFLRIPVMLCAISAVIISGAAISSEVPPIKLGQDAAEELLLTNNAIKSKEKRAGVFSFLKVTNTAQPDKMSEKANKKDYHSSAVSSPEKLPLPTPGAPGNVNITNSTDYTVNISDYLIGPPSFLNNDVSVLIVHTHTTESYTQSVNHTYTPTDTDRTTDKNFNTARVGKEIYDILKQNGIKVIHDTTINDYPSYNGSYNRSGTNISNAIKNDPSIKIVLDVHRDAIEGTNGEKIKYTTAIDGKNAACIMFVAGSNLSGSEHSEWETNMQFAATLQQHIQALYPGLMRPLNFRSQRFNQHLAPGAIIVEVGTNGNTLDEALLGARYFANALADYILKIRK